VILLERSGAMRAGREALRERIESITRRTETLGNPDLAHCVTQWCAIFLAPIQPWLAAE
jgi:hypothetical protein